MSDKKEFMILTLLKVFTMHQIKYQIESNNVTWKKIKMILTHGDDLMGKQLMKSVGTMVS